MRHRFETNKKNSSTRNIIISIVIFLLIFFCFWLAVSSASSKTLDEEKNTLSAAVTRSVTHCYAIEGNYPESLEYLKDNYGLTYDEDKFFIDYQPLGADIMPDITIIVKKGERK